LKDIWPQPFYLVGLIDDNSNKIGLKLGDYPVLGGSSCLLKVIEDESITDLILAISGEMNGTMFQAILDAQECGVDITTMPVVYEDILGRVPIFLLETDWIVRTFVDQARTSFFYEMGKRFVDILGGLVGALLMIPFLPILAIAIVLDTGFPIFFLQYRLGKSGKPYKIIKFRTMSQDAEKDGIVRITTENDNRITRVGWLLRRTHLDEWPQFINVLKGEMSLVGPRAERSELVRELQQKIPFYRARLLIKPGITGWAQINFGYAVSVEDTAVKLEYDLYYIKHRNLIMDLVIMLRTVGSVVGFRGQ
jgi:lipopolysaccharide/colanic/teichoic acid biosynthesis glycosyltransferase